jgi:hypothetical protein
VKLYGTAEQPRGGMTATIGYRNRVQEWKVPDETALPIWGNEGAWEPHPGSAETGWPKRSEGSES